MTMTLPGHQVRSHTLLVGFMIILCAASVGGPPPAAAQTSPYIDTSNPSVSVDYRALGLDTGGARTSLPGIGGGLRMPGADQPRSQLHVAPPAGSRLSAARRTMTAPRPPAPPPVRSQAPTRRAAATQAGTQTTGQRRRGATSRTATCPAAGATHLCAATPSDQITAAVGEHVEAHGHIGCEETSLQLSRGRATAVRQRSAAASNCPATTAASCRTAVARGRSATVARPCPAACGRPATAARLGATAAACRCAATGASAESHRRAAGLGPKSPAKPCAPCAAAGSHPDCLPQG